MLGFYYGPRGRASCLGPLKNGKTFFLFRNYLRVSTCRCLKGSSQLYPLTSRGERETTHTIQPLVWFQVWRNRRPQRKHWLDLGKLPLMVGSDGLNSRLAPSHKLLSSFQGSTDRKHRREFPQPLEQREIGNFKFQFQQTESQIVYCFSTFTTNFPKILLGYRIFV